MYKVQFLPLAQNDLVELVRYISYNLDNKQAAARLADEIIKTTDTLADFPYAYPAYIPIRPTENEYRKISVQNYLIFYSVNEKTKTVTIARVVYAKRNYDNLIR